MLPDSNQTAQRSVHGNQIPSIWRVQTPYLLAGTPDTGCALRGATVGAQCKDPFEKSYKNKLLSDIVTPSPREKLYSFLLSRKIGKHHKGVNGPLKKHGIPQDSSGKTLVASLLHVVAKTVQHSEGSKGMMTE
jgi:hypothetical protein